MFLNALNRNPLVPFSYDGYQKGYWYNYTQTQTGSVQGYDIRVYGTDARDLANYLKRQLPITDISVGVAQRAGHQVVKVLYSKNLHRGSFAPIKKPQPPVGSLHSFSSAFDQGYNK